MNDNKPHIITKDFEEKLDDVFIHPPSQLSEFSLLHNKLRESVESNYRLSDEEAQRLAQLIDERVNSADPDNRYAAGSYSSQMAQVSGQRLEALTAASILIRSGYNVSFNDPEVKKIQERDSRNHSSASATDSQIENLGSGLSPIPTTAPVRLREKYQLIGARFYFAHQPDRVAFEEVGNKIKTAHDSVVVAKDMVDLAKSKGWDTLKVSGSDAFKRIIWIESQLKGMNVKGYKPNEADFSLLQKRRKEISTEQSSKNSPRETEEEADKVNPLSGVLVAHGADHYKHDATKSMSYFVTLTNSDGKDRTVWGKELRSAIADSNVTSGERITLVNLGKTKVEVDKLNSKGRKTGERIITHRNSWEIKADSVRQDSPSKIIEKHPDLLSSAAVVALASKFSERLPKEADRRQFNTIAREELAQRIERNDPIATINIKGKQARPNRDHTQEIK